jgi:hypothetical protein
VVAWGEPLGREVCWAAVATQDRVVVEPALQVIKGAVVAGAARRRLPLTVDQGAVEVGHNQASEVLAERTSSRACCFRAAVLAEPAVAAVAAVAAVLAAAVEVVVAVRWEAIISFHRKIIGGRDMSVAVVAVGDLAVPAAADKPEAVVEVVVAVAELSQSLLLAESKSLRPGQIPVSSPEEAMHQPEVRGRHLPEPFIKEPPVNPASLD